MVQVAPVRLTYNPKVLWFDPNNVAFEKGDALIVKTERGLEYGRADAGVTDIAEDVIENLGCELKPVVRKATPEDDAQWQKMKRLSEGALPIFRQMVAEQKLDMHPVTVEFLFDGDKAVFYFESDDRIDFRELVRMLAARFHVRIDMRQIGVRDEARIVGGLGHCGQELCCKRLGGEFNPVSIRMAKDQDLSLNPQKISGVCGRLMCCLRYEVDTYKECKCRCPKMNSMIETPEGDAKVVEINVPREMVTLLNADDKRIKVPLADMVVNKKTGKPYKVTRDVYEECVNNTMSATPAAETLVTTLFTGSDKLAPTESRKSNSDSEPRRGNRRRQETDDSRKPRRRPTRRRGGTAVGSNAPTHEMAEVTRRNQRDNRRANEDSGNSGNSGHAGNSGSVSKQARPKQQKKNQAQNQQKRNANTNAAPRSERPRQKPEGARRPGQRSSGLSGNQNNQGANNQPKINPAQSTGHRKSRRRSHKAQGGDAS